jgi:hypothetical protein
MSRLVLIIIVASVFTLSRIVLSIRQRQEEARRARQRSAVTRSDIQWEFQTVSEAPVPEKEIEGETASEQVRKIDDEFQVSIDEYGGPDEESFKEGTQTSEESLSTRGLTRPSEPEEKKPSAPPTHEPVKIAGIALTPRTISQGIIISEILRRPEY